MSKRIRTALLHVSVFGVALVVATACSSSESTSSNGGSDSDGIAGNRYAQTNLAANKSDYHAKFTFPGMVNAWGIADRPKGAGGHFWVGAGGTSFQFVGDVSASPDAKQRDLHQDPLTEVSVPGADADTSDAGKGKITGVLFNPAPITSDKFVVTDQPVQVDGVEQKLTGSARFVFATDSGVISGWTEQGADGSIVRRPGPAVTEFDGGPDGMKFFGIALAPGGDTMLAADFGADPQVRTFDKTWHPIPTTGFANPFATGALVDPVDPAKGKKPKPGDPAPFNVSTVGDRVFVAYAKTKASAQDANAFDAGEEDSADEDQEKAAGDKPGHGKVAEFDAAGRLVRKLDDEGRFNSPWGVTVAPEDFGPLSGKILVGNFGGAGRIQAFDDSTGKFVDYLRDKSGEPVAVQGLWGLMFGNGESLGDSNALYFTAGPDDEKDGLFGALRLKK